MDEYCNSGKRTHIDIPPHSSGEYRTLINGIAMKLQYYMNIINPGEKLACLMLLEKTENLLFYIIYNLIMNNTDIVTSNSEIYNLITYLRRSFVYDTEHDFGIGTSREECKNFNVQKCITSLQDGYPTLHNYLVQVIHDGITEGIVNNCIYNAGDKEGSVTDECRDTFNSICYTIRDTKIKGIAKSTLDISTGGKTLYKAISSIIDPAGCSSDKLETQLIRPDLELHIYNIGLIFYQCFYTDFWDTETLLYITFSENIIDLYKKKNFNIFLYNVKTYETSTMKVIGGCNSPFSAEKICNTLLNNFSQFKNKYSGFPDNPYYRHLVRGFQLVLKGYGDFGQLFFTTFIYYTPISDDQISNFYTENVDISTIIPFYNNCILETIDTFLACIAVYIKAPIIIGTDINWHHYIIDVNKRYVGKNVVESYNMYNKLKISVGLFYNIYDKKIFDVIFNALTNQNISNMIMTNIDFEIINREYSDYYNEKIKLYIISSGYYHAGGYDLMKITGYSVNTHIFEIEHINTDINFWRLDNGSYIDYSTIYPGEINDPLFRTLSKITKTDKYNRFVSSDIFCGYIKIVIFDKLAHIMKKLSQRYNEYINKNKTRIREDQLNIIIKSAILIYYFLNNPLKDVLTEYLQPERANYRSTNPDLTLTYINLNKGALDNLDYIFIDFVNYTKFIHSNLETMYHNIQLIREYFREDYQKGNPVAEYYSKILSEYSQISRFEHLAQFNANVQQFNDIIFSELDLVFRSLHCHIITSNVINFNNKLKHDPNPESPSYKDYDFNRYMQQMDNGISLETSETHFKLSGDQKNAIQTYYSYLKNFKTYMYELRENSNNIAYILRQIQQEDSTYPKFDETDYKPGHIHPEAVLREYSTWEQLATNYIKGYNQKILWRLTNPNHFSNTLCTPKNIAYMIYVRFMVIFTFITKHIHMLEQYKQDEVPEYNIDDYTEVFKAILTILKTIVETGHDKIPELIGRTLNLNLKIVEFISKIFDTTVYDGEIINSQLEYIDFSSDISPFEDEIDRYIAYSIEKKINSISNQNFNSKLAKECIYNREIVKGAGYKNFSKKIIVYLKKIENITNTIKLLKKNKILNKDKIIKNNQIINDLKLKIKEEKEKEKLKKEKEKEKEKEKLKKEKEKEKEKLKKEKEKNEKLKKEKLKTNNNSKKQQK